MTTTFRSCTQHSVHSCETKACDWNHILQVNRAAFNQNEVDPTCLVRMEEPETVDHFRVKCSAFKIQETLFKVYI